MFGCHIYLISNNFHWVFQSLFPLKWHDPIFLEESRHFGNLTGGREVKCSPRLCADWAIRHRSYQISECFAYFNTKSIPKPKPNFKNMKKTQNSTTSQLFCCCLRCWKVWSCIHVFIHVVDYGRSFRWKDSKIEMHPPRFFWNCRTLFFRRVCYSA